MFFIRYSWTLPLRAQFAVCMALIVVLLGMHRSNGQAEDFATLHHRRCLMQHDTPAASECVSRTIQLAAQMHGTEFGNQVADVLH